MVYRASLGASSSACSASRTSLGFSGKNASLNQRAIQEPSWLRDLLRADAVQKIT